MLSYVVTNANRLLFFILFFLYPLHQTRTYPLSYLYSGLPCTDNVRDSRFSCDCFNYEPDTILNCPRTVCVYDFYGDEECADLPSGGSGPISNNDPIQCTVNGFDECEDVTVCIDSPNIESYCVPDSSDGVDFGCCKSMFVSLLLCFKSLSVIITKHVNLMIFE